MNYDIPEVLANLNPLGMESLLWNSRGHIPQIDSMHIAHALSQVRSKGAGYLLRLKYAGEDVWWADLEEALYSKTIHWKTPKAYIETEPFRRACRLAIWEHIHPHVCPTCLGRAQALIGDKLVVCAPCSGTARILPTNESRSELLEIGSDWPEFLSRYSRIQNILQGWEMGGLTSLSKALYSR